MTMIVINIAQAKAKLSEYLEAVASGERVVISKRNTPIAELRAIAPARTDPRPIGLAAGQFVVPDTFFEPLPEDVAQAFEDGAPHQTHSRVAERRAKLGVKPRRRR